MLGACAQSVCAVAHLCGCLFWRTAMPWCCRLCAAAITVSLLDEIAAMGQRGSGALTRCRNALPVKAFGTCQFTSNGYRLHHAAVAWTSFWQASLANPTTKCAMLFQ